MNSFGRIFKIEIFGESHGNYVGVVIDGVPPGIRLTEKELSLDLQRRKPGAIGTTTRIEDDKPEILSGIYNNKTTGTPILIKFANKNVKRTEYSQFIDIPRPGHADFVAFKKYAGFSDISGGGHFSGRMTVGLVAASTLAKKIISPVSIKAELINAGGSKDIETEVSKALDEQDSIGGLIECKAANVPIGLGEPFFDTAESVISQLIFAIPGIKAIEFGAGFNAVNMRGSEFNDVYIDSNGRTKTNNNGGISGGITNGNELVFRVAVRPPSSIGKPQTTYNFKTGKLDTLIIKGRHDSCIALRVPVIVEAALAIALADLMLINNALKNT
ncbi:MAG: chorismate synthase [Ignavibacteria bacterium]|nr:chorismate synthase [Ignavibacteria bacterium]